MKKPALKIKNFKSFGITKISEMNIPGKYIVNVDLIYSNGVAYYLEKEEYTNGFNPGAIDFNDYSIGETDVIGVEIIINNFALYEDVEESIEGMFAGKLAPADGLEDVKKIE